MKDFRTAAQTARKRRILDELANGSLFMQVAMLHAVLCAALDKAFDPAKRVWNTGCCKSAMVIFSTVVSK